MRKYKLLSAILCLLVLKSLAQPGSAGPCGWLKKLFTHADDVPAPRPLAPKVVEGIDEAISLGRSVNRYADRATTAFQVGAYTFTGYLIFDSLMSIGYAGNGNSEYEDEKVAREIADAAGSGESLYVETYCTDPENQVRFVVPTMTKVCPDASTPQIGNGINLDTLRTKASG